MLVLPIRRRRTQSKKDQNEGGQGWGGRLEGGEGLREEI